MLTEKIDISQEIKMDIEKEDQPVLPDGEKVVSDSKIIEENPDKLKDIC